MRPTDTRLLLALFLLFTIRVSQSLAMAAADQNGFDQGLREVREILESGKWPAAKRRILELVEEHGDQPYVRARLAEIQENYGRASLGLAVPPPHPREIVSGKLVTWSRSNDRISIRYGKTGREDFVEKLDISYHPMVLTGPYTIKLSGAKLPNDPEKLPRILFGCKIGNPVSCVACPGFVSSNRQQRIPAFLYGGLSGRTAERVGLSDRDRAINSRLPPNLRTREPTVLEGFRAFEVELEVSKDDAVLTIDGSPLGPFPLLEGEADGSIAITNFDVVDEIEIRGTAHPGWIRDLVERATTERREQWLETHDPLEGLPAWAQFEDALFEDVVYTALQKDFGAYWETMTR